MTKVLYMESSDIAGSAKNIPFVNLQIKHLKAIQFRESLSADIVYLNVGNREYILKDRESSGRCKEDCDISDFSHLTAI
jgi:hypothetical protein